MERIVIVAYKPKQGREEDLLKLVRDHWSVLNNEGLVSERTPIISRSATGIIIEVFGWKSEKAIQSAHSNQTVQKLWEDFAKMCDYIPLNEVPESKDIFSEFEGL